MPLNCLHAFMVTFVTTAARAGCTDEEGDDSLLCVRPCSHSLLQTDFILKKESRLRVQAQTPRPLTCDTTFSAAKVGPVEACGPGCPYTHLLSSSSSETWCQFQCVEKSQCGTLDVNATVADGNFLECRRCRVPGCHSCDVASGQDFCAECETGYLLSKDGTCTSQSTLWDWVPMIAAAILVWLCIWFLELRSRPITNSVGLRTGLSFRSRSRLHRIAQVPVANEPEENDNSDDCSDHDSDGISQSSSMSSCSSVSMNRNESVLTTAHRQLWPLRTNLLTENVAGCGLGLFFRFQVAIIVWAALVLACWCLTAFAVSSELFVLGTRSTDSQRKLCWVTSWGHGVQIVTMHGKVAFLFATYFISFIGALVFAVLQHRHAEDNDYATMMDYAAVITGLPRSLDSPEDTAKAEDRLARCIESSTGQQVVGVSICYEFSHDVAGILEIAQQDLYEIQLGMAIHLHRSSISFDQKTQPQKFDCLRRLVAIDHLLGYSSTVQERRKRYNARGISCHRTPESGGTRKRRTTVKFEDESDDSSSSCVASANSSRDENPSEQWTRSSGESHASHTQRMLEGLKCAGVAYVVFHSEISRDNAVAAAAKMAPGELLPQSILGVPMQGQEHCGFERAKDQPESVLWGSFDGERRGGIALRLFGGFLIMVVCLVIWTLFAFMPYASYIMSFNYNSTTPSMYGQYFLSGLLLLGNQLMYLACRFFATRAGFWSSSSEEAAYLVLYTVMNFMYLVFDLYVVYLTTARQLKGMDAHTFDGQALNNFMPMSVALFESYPMQRLTGNVLMTYAFPWSFIVPFIIEPLLTIAVPNYIAELLVRSHPEIRGGSAERSLAYFTPMDFGRYADIMLNLYICVLIFFFPGGFTHRILLAMIGCHIYIYCLDHFRVLRCVPGFTVSTGIVDWYVHYLLTIPCAIILGCAFFKASLIPASSLSPALRSFQETFFMRLEIGVAAVTLHLAVHCLLLYFVVPRFVRSSRKQSGVTYNDLASETACTWFSANPVHCLRSKYLYNHTPHCAFFIRGKEHLLRVNPDIGCYYDGMSALQGET